jgi:hypothetical protein
MQYFVNQIWLNKETSLYYRILHIAPQLEVLSWIKIRDESKDFPETINLEDFEELVKDDQLSLVTNEIVQLPAPEDLKSDALKKWEKNWNAIKDYVTEAGLLYDEKRLKYLLNTELPKSSGITRFTIRRIFLRYWQRGMSKLAIIPHYTNSGGKGKIKKFSQVKRGRPTIYSKNESNVNEKIKKLIIAGYHEFYLNRKEATLQNAYETFIALKFSTKGKRATIGPIPTYTQFRYWGEKAFSSEEKLKKKIGDIIFNKDYTILTDSSRKNVLGPGSIFQIDSTPSDVELVSELNGSPLTGSPTLYLVTDVFSGMIVGFHASYENPSYWIAMLALANAIENKKEFCARFGISLEAEDWPSNHLPTSILADRGELLGNQAENLASQFGITVANTVAYRPDMKGLVERHFQTVHKKLKTIRNDIGLKGQKHGERGVRNARLDACLTLKKYIHIITLAIIEYNSTNFLTSYPLDRDMVADQVKPVPNILWNWGIKNRSGALRTINNKDFQLRLLPRKKVSLTKKGIKFLNHYYNLSEGPAEIIEQIRYLQISKQSKRTEVEIAYHPWDVSQIYLFYQGRIVIFIISESRNPIGKDANIWEAEQYSSELKRLKFQHEEETLDRRVDIIKAINEIATEAKQEAKLKRSSSNIKKIREDKNSEKTLNRSRTTGFKAPGLEAITDDTKNSPSVDKPIDSQDYTFPSFIEDIEKLIND